MYIENALESFININIAKASIDESLGKYDDSL